MVLCEVMEDVGVIVYFFCFVDGEMYLVDIVDVVCNLCIELWVGL